jgi:CheY-like chemotaxis protein
MPQAHQFGSLFPDQKERTPAILVVEDEILLRMAVSDYLQECGFKIYEAGTASEAIEMIESGRFVIDLVFSDVRMPGAVDGFGLAQWVRKNRPTCHPHLRRRQEIRSRKGALRERAPLREAI